MSSPVIVSFWASKVLEAMIQESLEDIIPPTLSPEELECKPNDPQWERDALQEIELYKNNWKQLCQTRNNS